MRSRPEDPAGGKRGDFKEQCNKKNSPGFLFPALNAVILSRAEVRHRGKVSGVLVMLFDSAFFGFAFITGPLAYNLGYFNMYYTLAFIMLAGFLIYSFFEKILKTNR